jgi:hypothetical protein
MEFNTVPLSDEFWIPSGSAKQCADCEKYFHPFRRKHHCRFCGQVFCYYCTNYSVATPDNKTYKCCSRCLRRFNEPNLAEDSRDEGPTRRSTRFQTEPKEDENPCLDSQEIRKSNRLEINLSKGTDFIQNRVQEILENYELSLSWRQLITDHSMEIVHVVWPSVRYRDDNPNINNYVRIVCEDSANPPEPFLVNGVAFYKNVAHRRMNTHITQPRILILEGSAEYCSSEAKLISMDTVINLEAEFNQILVKKLLSAKPTLVLIEQGMSQSVLSDLRQKKITVILNIKLSLLKMIARCTHAQVLSSINQISVSFNPIGSCEVFEVLKLGKRSLCVLRNCPDPSLGATIVLSGPRKSELKLLKAVLRTLILEYRGYLLELYFMTQFGLPLSATRACSTSIHKLQIQNTKPCEDIERLTVDFYMENDVPLGKYCMTQIARADKICSCGNEMRTHCTYYISSSGQVKVHIEIPLALSDEPIGESIVFERNCTACGSDSSSTLSEISWEFSFFHFLHLMLTNKTEAKCGHRFFQDSSIILETSGIKVFFVWQESVVFELLPLTPKLTNTHGMLIAQNIEEFKAMSSKAVHELISLANSLKVSVYEGHGKTTEEHKARWKELRQEASQVYEQCAKMMSYWMKMSFIGSLSLIEVEGKRRSFFLELCDCKISLQNLANSVNQLVTSNGPASTNSFLGVLAQPLEMIRVISNSISSSSSSDIKSFHSEIQSSFAQEDLDLPLREDQRLNESEFEYLRHGYFTLPLGHNSACIPVDSDDIFSMIAHALNSEEYYSSVIQKVNHESPEGLIESILLSESECHFIVQLTSQDPSVLTDSVFSPGANTLYGDMVSLKVVCYFATQFQALRGYCLGSHRSFLESIMMSSVEMKKLGKSRASFVFSHDRRFLLKLLSEQKEVSMFLEMAPNYFRHTCKTLFHNMPSRLSPILGVYKINFKNATTHAKQVHWAIIQDNIGFGLDPPMQVYDLKGTLNSNRYVKKGDSRTKMDLNFIEDHNGQPILISNEAKRVLNAALHNDSLFLSKQNVMDYSLLLMYNLKDLKLNAAVIDYSGQYTLEKLIESHFKRAVKHDIPTVISPDEYKVRFRHHMTHIFILGVSNSLH